MNRIIRISTLILVLLASGCDPFINSDNFITEDEASQAVLSEGRIFFFDGHQASTSNPLCEMSGDNLVTFEHKASGMQFALCYADVRVETDSGTEDFKKTAFSVFQEPDGTKSVYLMSKNPQRGNVVDLNPMKNGQELGSRYDNYMELPTEEGTSIKVHRGGVVTEVQASVAKLASLRAVITPTPEGEAAKTLVPNQPIEEAQKVQTEEQPPVEVSPTPEALIDVNKPTPMEYEALRTGPVEMTIEGNVVSIQEFVKDYVETGKFSDWLVDQATRNGTLPKGDPPKGLARDDLSTYQINAYDTKRTASKLIQRGVPVGNLNSIGMVIGEQDYAVSQGVWGITIPSPPVGDRNRDGELHLWVRGVVLATGDPEHPYVGAPVVHTALEEMSGGFDGSKSYMRGYCRPDVRFGIVMADPVASSAIIGAFDKHLFYLDVIAVLHALDLDNPGFALPHGVVMSFSGSEPSPDAGLRPMRMEDLPVMGGVLRGRGFDWREVRTAVFVDRSF